MKGKKKHPHKHSKKHHKHSKNHRKDKHGKMEKQKRNDKQDQTEKQDQHDKQVPNSDCKVTWFDHREEDNHYNEYEKLQDDNNEPDRKSVV